MSGCKNCTKSCPGCGPCSTLELNNGEIQVLETLSQIPFLPAARKPDSMEPFYLEDSRFSREEASLILQCLEKKQLIDIRYDPLQGFDYRAYAGLPVHGSFALTERGQKVLELLEIQGYQ